MTKPSKCGGVMSEIFFFEKKKLYKPRKNRILIKSNLCSPGNWYDLILRFEIYVSLQFSNRKVSNRKSFPKIIMKNYQRVAKRPYLLSGSVSSPH